MDIDVWLNKFHSRPLSVLDGVEYIPVYKVRDQLGLSKEW
jgi:hypothetical protein